MKNENMKNLVREDFKQDQFNELIGFLEVENTVDVVDIVSDFTEAGTVLVAYRNHNGELSFEKLTEMVDNIIR